MLDPLVSVSDVHHGDEDVTKSGSAALLLRSERGRVLAEVRPDAGIDVGDRSADSDGLTDLRRAR